MEEITGRVNNIALGDSQKTNRIQVSSTKRPIFFYVNLAKRHLVAHNEVELSAIGTATATVVSVAEILKNKGLAVEKKIMTSTTEVFDESRGRSVRKAMMEIILRKSAKCDELMAAAQGEENVNVNEQN